MAKKEKEEVTYDADDVEQFIELVEKLHQHILKSTDPKKITLLAINKLSGWIREGDF